MMLGVYDIMLCIHTVIVLSGIIVFCHFKILFGEVDNISFIMDKNQCILEFHNYVGGTCNIVIIYHHIMGKHCVFHYFYCIRKFITPTNSALITADIISKISDLSAMCVYNCRITTDWRRRVHFLLLRYFLPLRI